MIPPTKQTVYQSSLLWNAVTKIGILILVVICMRVWMLSEYLSDVRQERDVVFLTDFVDQFAQQQSQLFADAEENLKQLSRSYFEQIYQPTDFSLQTLFDKRFITNNDRITRINPNYKQSAYEAHTFIDSKLTINDDVKKSALIQHQLVTAYGKAWSNRFVSTFLVSHDGVYSNYWSGINWNKTPLPETSFYSLAWAGLQEKKHQHLVKNTPIWTDIWYDKISSGWLLNCILPAENGKNIKINAGISVRMNELVNHLSTLHLEHSFVMIMNSSGDLISHPHFMHKIAEMNGKFNVKHYYDKYLYNLYNFVHTSFEKNNPNQLNTLVLDHQQYEETVVVSKIKGPNWYVISTYANAQAEHVQRTAIISLLINLGFLLLELTLMYFILKKTVNLPISELTSLAHNIVSTGDVNVKMPKNYKLELQLLADAFEILLRFIHDRDSKLIEANTNLEKANSELETKVLLRTNELNLKNTTLQQEIFARETLNELITNERHILELIANRNPLSQILAKICSLIEKQIPDSICCVMLVDENKKELLVGASPRMPEIFLHKLHHTAIQEQLYTCSTAVFLGKRVIAKEIKNNNSWNDVLKSIALDIKLKSCWSTPIVSTSKELASQRILGTLAVYHKIIYHPLPKDFSIVDRILQLCSVAIEREQIERKLTSSEEMYRTIFESSNDGIILFGVNNGNIIDVNQRVKLILGYELDELKSMSNLSFMVNHDESIEEHSEYSITKIWQYFQLALMGKTQLFEWHFPLKNGGFSWLEIMFKQAFIHGQIMILAVIRDINQRKLSEKLLIASEENYRTIFDSANDAIIVHNPADGYILDLNQKASELLKCGSLKHIQLENFDVLCTITHEKYTCKEYLNYLNHAFENGETLFEWLGTTHQNDHMWLEISLKRTIIHGNPRILAVIRDISERKRSQELIQQQNLQLSENIIKLEQLNQDKNDFLGIAAHDLKNPLNSITLGADMMIEDYDEFTKEETIKYLNQIKYSSNRMLTIINELLDINRIECGKLSVRLRNFNFSQLIHECVENSINYAHQKDIHIQTDFIQEQNVYADHSSTYECVENLISNAIKYSPYNTTIWVTLKEIPETGKVRFEVTDQGPGLSKEDQKLLFQKFTKLTARPTNGEHSTGLGLSIVKKLIESMNGDVFCKSELGKGSSFGFDLPKYEK